MKQKKSHHVWWSLSEASSTLGPSCLLSYHYTCLTFQSSWSGFGAVRYGGAVCTYPASCCVLIGLYPPAALLQRRLPDSHWPRQRTCPTGSQVIRQEFFLDVITSAYCCLSVCTLHTLWLTVKHIVYLCLSLLSDPSFSPPREEELRSSVNVISET